MSNIDDFYGMVEQVREVSIEAAEYLLNRVKSEGFSDDPDGVSNTGDLENCIIFEYTVQGHDYWEDIYSNLPNEWRFPL